MELDDLRRGLVGKVVEIEQLGICHSLGLIEVHINAPSQRSIRHFLPVYAHIRSISVLRMSTAASTMFIPANDRGVMTDEHPRIRRMLNTFEPRMKTGGV